VRRHECFKCVSNMSTPGQRCSVSNPPPPITPKKQNTLSAKNSNGLCRGVVPAAIRAKGNVLPTSRDYSSNGLNSGSPFHRKKLIIHTHRLQRPHWSPRLWAVPQNGVKANNGLVFLKDEFWLKHMLALNWLPRMTRMLDVNIVYNQTLLELTSTRGEPTAGVVT